MPLSASALDRNDLAKATLEISSALRDRNFARLEEMHAHFLRSGARTSDGSWMIQAFQRAFGTHFRNEPPKAAEKFFAEWRKRVPASALRPVAEAFAWQERAWLAKGRGCASQRPPSSRAAFEGLVARAAEALREGEAAGQELPLWHVVAILVAGAQGRAPEELDALLDGAARRFPAYTPLYAARMTFFLPDWGGDFESVDRFVRASVERTRDTEGRAMYAWLYVSLAQGCGKLFDESRVDWPDLRAAFDDLLERHPDTWNRNLYATFACRARDIDTTVRLLGELGTAATLGAWSPGISTEGCRQMVRPPAAPSRAL